MPFVLRVFGLDVSLGGAPMAAHVHMLSFSPAGMLISKYPERGKSLTSSPKGYRINSLHREIGHGSDTWRRAKHAIETGDALELPWVKIWRWGNSSHWKEQDSFIIAARILPFIWTVNVNRVVKVKRRSKHISITWGTTGRHVLRGEETVAIQKRNDGKVVFKLRSFSRPNAFIGWLGYPIVVYKQTAFAKDVYKRLQGIVNDSPD